MNGIQLLTVALSKIFVPLRSAISNRQYSSTIILRSFLPYFWFVKGYGTIIEKTPLGERSCNPSSIKGTYKSHFSLSDLYFLHATMRCLCSFNSGDAICVGALMYGGLPIVMSNPPSFEVACLNVPMPVVPSLHRNKVDDFLGMTESIASYCRQRFRKFL